MSSLGTVIWNLSPQIWDQFQVYSMNSRGYYAGERERNAFSQPLQSKVVRAQHQNGKSSTPDRARLTGELCLIIGDSLSAVLCVWACVCVCFPVLQHVCVCVHICVIWHFPFEHTWQGKRRHRVSSKHSVTIKGGGKFCKLPIKWQQGERRFKVLLNVTILWPLLHVHCTSHTSHH